MAPNYVAARKAKPYNIADVGGLFLLVHTNVSKYRQFARTRNIHKKFYA